MSGFSLIVPYPEQGASHKTASNFSSYAGSKTELSFCISATFSMASSEFLAARSEGRTDAMKSCTYTGIAYLLTVILLIAPYLLFPADQFLPALFCMLAMVVLIIAGFTFYTSVAQDQKFGKHFLEMAGISIGVAVVSFVVGILAKKFLGEGDRVLIIDDFLANGSALNALLDLCRQAGATAVGAGIVIEKAYQPGGEVIRRRGIRVESLARIASMSVEDGIKFC